MPPAQAAPRASHLVLQVMEVVINGLEMAPVMIQTTLKPAHLMVETVVDLMSIQYFAQCVIALKEEGVEEIQRHHLEQLLEFVISGLEMGSVMISTII